MRAMLNSKTVDRDSTYSYTDRQVLNLFQFSMCLGVFIGGITVSAVMRLLGH